FDHNYTAPDGSYSSRSYGDGDGKISSMGAGDPSPYPPTNIVPGCGLTRTTPFKSYIREGWNSRSPRWLVIASDTEYASTRQGGVHPQNWNPGAAFDDPALDALQTVFADIAAFRKSKAIDGPVPLAINGVNTDGGLDFERYSMQRL
ncbi:hypothetical protein, partial [Stenotrophomonas sp. GbtcB23]|uniref:hypothetical protein n=1 Tax=Stenotrophomonas sp. GbtcB23 TaxID=2824768 RepID=UPI001C2FCCF0